MGAHAVRSYQPQAAAGSGGVQWGRPAMRASPAARATRAASSRPPPRAHRWRGSVRGADPDVAHRRRAPANSTGSAAASAWRRSTPRQRAAATISATLATSACGVVGIDDDLVQGGPGRPVGRPEAGLGGQYQVGLLAQRPHGLPPVRPGRRPGAGGWRRPAPRRSRPAADVRARTPLGARLSSTPGWSAGSRRLRHRRAPRAAPPGRCCRRRRWRPVVPAGSWSEWNRCAATGDRTARLGDQPGLQGQRRGWRRGSRPR